ncbi:cytochrome P450 4c3-like [Hetaerina americana]|uniref:cytochrome P450 4c3-like n=1 Tax=Hetaerina americana TaxID=62018 RepID=UPI003A7F3D28
MDWIDSKRFEGLVSSKGLVLFAVIIVLIAAYWRKFLRYVRINLALYRVPGPFAYPIIGNSRMFKGKPEDFFQVLLECHKRYGPMFRLWVGTRPIVFLCGAEELQPLLSSSVHIKKSLEYTLFEPWLGEGLITSAGKKWQERRKLLTSAFHSSLLESYIDSLYKEASKLTSKLVECTPQETPSDWSEGIDIGKLTKLAALDAVCETTMGFNIKALEGNSNFEYTHAISRLNQILQRRFINPWLTSDIIFYNTALGKEFSKHLKTVHDFTEKVIRERMEEIKAYSQGSQPTQENNRERLRRKSFLDLLLNLSKGGLVLSNEDIREEVDTFMFAGHDSIAGGMNWSLYTLGHHPEAQVCILEEAKAVMGNDTKITLSHINKMEYFDRCIKEAFRLYPPVPLTGRQLESPLTIKGHTFPAGTEFNILHFMLHHDPKTFPDPFKFDPDRFLPSENLTRNPFAYMPFSAGPRNCIGQKFAILEVKLVVLRILQNLEVRSVCKMEDLRLQGEVLLNSPDGVILAFRKRE